MGFFAEGLMNYHAPHQNFSQRVIVAGQDLVMLVKKLAAEGTVRRLVISKADGTPLMDIPLSAGVAIGGVSILLAPILTAVASIAALVTKVQVDIIREPPDHDQIV
jgi:hypothetical protein